jgi:cell division protein WhiA
VTFTQDVKRELDTIDPRSDHCRRAEASGLLFGAGTVDLAAGGRVGVRVSVALPATARRLLALLRPYGVEAGLRTVNTAPVGLRYEVLIGENAHGLQALNELGVLSDDYSLRMAVPERLVRRRCCLAAFARGMFLGCGSISMPGTPVHAEFTLEDVGLARELAGQLARLGLAFSVAERGRNAACYTKRGETAADLLTVLGAHDARLRWEEHLVLGQVRESANRLANCDEANARRAAAAAGRQAAAARRLMASDGWSGVPAAVRDAARLRLKYPYLSLEELAAKARPRLTKSALNHRLRRLEALAGEPAAPGRHPSRAV